MALIIPTSYSTYADATSAPGGPLSPYILAQLPADAEFGWLADIRRMAAIDEVKWKVFQARRERLQAKTELWRSILQAMATATIVVIKPAEVADEIQSYLRNEGAEEGPDYNTAGIINVCSIELVADTPVAYLPNRISQSLGLYSNDLYLSFDRFAPVTLLQRVGGKLRDAKVFAARAHAMFDSAYLEDDGARTIDAFRPMGKLVVLQELLATQRNFDQEHPKSVAVLNEAADTIAESLAGAMLMPGDVTDQPLVQEYDSRDIDQLQAADIAAGWAHELIALGNEQALLSTFGRVLINGKMLK